MTSRGRRLLATAGACVLAVAACSNDSPAGAMPGGSSAGGTAAAAPSGDLPATGAPIIIPNAGTIEGHVRLDGRAPGNTVIRMAMDPKCDELTRGQMVVQAEVVANAEGDLGNVFVYLEGDLPKQPPSPEPVRIEQQDCIYVPRVVGVQIGQTLEITNDDDLNHNVHATSRAGNGFNVGQPRAGAMNRFQPASAEVMMRIGCDVHRWMVGYVGVLDHPYFAVTAEDGTFRIGNLPAGTYTIHTWHERFGERTETIEVAADAVTPVELAYAVE